VRRAFPLIAGLLAYLMVPGAVEIVENVGHLITHADTAHADNGHAEDSSDDEHGCSGTYHACSCHHAPSFSSAFNTPVPPTRFEGCAAGYCADREANDSGFVSRLLRPPRAAA
jgi:hypothetical protein